MLLSTVCCITTLRPTACSVAFQDKRYKRQQLLDDCEALKASLPVGAASSEEGDDHQVKLAVVHLTMLPLPPGAECRSLCISKGCNLCLQCSFGYAPDLLTAPASA